MLTSEFIHGLRLNAKNLSTMKQLMIGKQSPIYNNIVMITACDEIVFLNRIAQVNSSLPIGYYFYEDGLRTHDIPMTEPKRHLMYSVTDLHTMNYRNFMRQVTIRYLLRFTTDTKSCS